MTIIEVTTRQQLDACKAVRLNVFVDEQQVPVEEEMDEYDASPQACHHLLLTDGDKPAATGRWRVYEDGTAKLQRIAVLKEYRGGGTGRQLMEALENSARQAGMKRTILDGQCQAEGFYNKLGYVTVSTEPFLDAGILHVRMQKEL